MDWNFSVTRDTGTKKVYLNFYGRNPLPRDQKVFFELVLKEDANQFKKGRTESQVRFNEADVIATSDGDESIDSPIETEENVGGPILLASVQPTISYLPLFAAVAVLALLAFVFLLRRQNRAPTESEE